LGETRTGLKKSACYLYYTLVLLANGLIHCSILTWRWNKTSASWCPLHMI